MRKKKKVFILFVQKSLMNNYLYCGIRMKNNYLVHSRS